MKSNTKWYSRPLLILASVFEFLFKAFVIVAVFAIMAVFMLLMHGLLHKTNTSSGLYWLGMICTFAVLMWALFPWFLIFPTKMAPEDLAKYRRL